MTEKLILEKLDHLENKVDKIEDAVGLIAVQTERLNNLTEQVNALWRKNDDAFGPTGVVSQVKSFQAGCPRDSIKDSLSRQWVIIGLLATTVVGIALKAFS